MQLLGFSLNLITLFALVLAIGIVVDNAIVVVEAVHAKMEHSNIGAKKATEKAMKEISGAIIAITLVMSAVFIPTAFMSGPIGVFYKQFSITIAIAIVLSGIVALTLTPALCALFLKNTHSQHKKKNVFNYFFHGFNSWYGNLSARYQKLLGIIINRKVITFSILLLFCAGTYYILPYRQLPAVFHHTFQGEPAVQLFALKQQIAELEWHQDHNHGAHQGCDGGIRKLPGERHKGKVAQANEKPRQKVKKHRPASGVLGDVIDSIHCRPLVQ